MVRDERLSMFAIFEGEIVTVCTVPVSPLSVHGKRPFKYLRYDLIEPRPGKSVIHCEGRD